MFIFVVEVVLPLAVVEMALRVMGVVRRRGSSENVLLIAHISVRSASGAPYSQRTTNNCSVSEREKSLTHAGHQLSYE